MEKVGGILKQLRKDAGISVKSVSEFLVNRGFKANASTIYSWENDNSQPTPGALLAMCEFYKVPDALSAFGYEIENDEDIHLNQNETKLIEKYRSLDEYGKEAVDKVLDVEFRRCLESSEAQNDKEPVKYAARNLETENTSSFKGEDFEKFIDTVTHKK